MVRERNYGLDFLRVFSMLLVVIVHVLGQGGVLDSATPGSANYWVAWFMESISICCVNCFTLISGYFLFVKNTKIASIASLWVQTLFYSITLTLLFYFLFPGTSMDKFDVAFSFAPVITKRYWYISAYIGMYIIRPLLNVIIENTKKLTMELVFIAVLFIYSGFSLVFDPFNLGDGCSVIWLSLIYLLGGYFRKYDIASKVRNYKGWLLFASMAVVALLNKYVIEVFTIIPEKFENVENCLIDIDSPTALLAAVGLFIATANMNIPKPLGKIISAFAPASLGVYLIHVAKPVWEDVFEGFAKSFVNYNPVIMAFLVLGSAAAIYFACSVIEIVRLYLFRLLKINDLFLWIEKLCERILNKLSNKFNEKEGLLTK